MEKLIKKLTLINSVNVNNTIYNKQLRTYITNKRNRDLITILDKQFGSYFERDLFDERDWISYDRCFNARFYLHKTKGNSSPKLCVNVCIYDGDNYNGEPTKLRWKATFILPIDFINLISDVIDDAFIHYLNGLYEDFLLEQRKTWVENMANFMLK